MRCACERKEVMQRRDFIVCTSVAATSLALGGCLFHSRAPKGWKRETVGHSSFYVPDNWKRVNIPDDAILFGWDWVMQDTSEFHDKSTTCRLLVMSHGIEPVIHNPPKDDTKRIAEFLSQTELFGGGTAAGINDSPIESKVTQTSYGEWITERKSTLQKSPTMHSSHKTTANQKSQSLA